MVKICDIDSIDLKAQLIDISRAECESSLYVFLKSAWHLFDPAPWVDGWCVEAMAEHLQAVVDGEIKRLIINIPPRCQKSSLCSVALAAWTWAQPVSSHTSGPGVSFLYASFVDSLALRDSRSCRKVIESDWYKQRWGDRFRLEFDNNTKQRFGNDKGGYRLVTSTDAKGATGEGGNILCIDDGNSAREVESEAVTEATNDWVDGTLGSRFNNQKLGALIEIQQRLGEKDITGHLLDKFAAKGNWATVVLPMRFETWRKTYMSPIGWSDPRTEEGELLWPERFGEDEVSALEEWMGPWRAAGQLQQVPQPKGGGIIQKAWWNLMPSENFPKMDYILACLDTAYETKKENDPSGMIIWGIFTPSMPAQKTQILDPYGEPVRTSESYSEYSPQLIMMYAWDARLALHDLVERTAAVCTKYKVDHLLIENKASGISVAQEIQRLYHRESFGVELFDPKSQDKMARLYSVQHIFAEGMVHCPETDWAQRVIDQVAQFPRGRHDEFVDLVSMGLRKLRSMGLLVRQAEREAELEEDRRYVGRLQPLYSV